MKDNKESSGIQYPRVTVWDVIKEFFKVAKIYSRGFSLVLITTTIMTVAGAVVAPIYYKQLFDVLSRSTDFAGSVPQLINIIIKFVVTKGANQGHYQPSISIRANGQLPVR